MAVNLSFIGGAGWQFFDNNGVPLAGGKIYTYSAGTTAPLATYTSRDGLVSNANPIVLDSAGRTPAQIWVTEGLLYKYTVTTADNVVLRTWDNIGGSVVASNLAQDLQDTTNNAKGDALVGFRQSNSLGFLTNAVARTVNDKLSDFVSVKDFGAVGDGVADDTVAIQNAMNTCAAGTTVYVPAGRYKITSTLTIPVYPNGHSGFLRSTKLVGDGAAFGITDINQASGTFRTTLVNAIADKTRPLFSLSGTRSVYLSDFNISNASTSIDRDVAIEIAASNGKMFFDRVSFFYHKEGVRVGRQGVTTANDDAIYINACMFDNVTTGVVNYGTESYGIYIDQCFFRAVKTCFKAVANSIGSIMNSAKIRNCFIGADEYVIYHESNSGTQDSRDTYVIDSCIIEPINSAPGLKLFYTDGQANNALGLTISNNTVNVGNDAAVFDKTYRFIRYYGRGQVNIFGNRFNVWRPIIEVSTFASTISSAAFSITGNWWIIKPGFVSPGGQDFPNIVASSNKWIRLMPQSTTDTLISAGDFDAQLMIAGRHVNNSASDPYFGLGGSSQTVRRGATFKTYDAFNATVTVTGSGTYGALSGVTLTALTGASDVIGGVTFGVATLVQGTTAQKQKITPGNLLRFVGTTTVMEVAYVCGSTVYLTTVYGGATTTDQPIEFVPPAVNYAGFGATAPASGTWRVGDTIHNTAPVSGGYIGWVCTVAGSPGTWRQYGLIT